MQVFRQWKNQRAVATIIFVRINARYSPKIAEEVANGP
jgi:hypothetical protein